MSEPPKLMVAMPCREEIKSSCFLALASCFVDAHYFWKKTHGESAAFIPLVVPQMHTAEARTFILEQAMSMEVDYLLWLDDDMTPPPKMLERLYATMAREKVALVGGLCYRRGEPYGPCAFTKTYSKELGHHHWMHRLPERVAEAEATGFAAVLMDVEQARHVYDVTNKQPFFMAKGCGEDAFYCEAMMKLGQRILIDTSIVPGHVGHFTYDHRFFESILPSRPELQRNFEPGS